MIETYSKQEIDKMFRKTFALHDKTKVKLQKMDTFVTLSDAQQIAEVVMRRGIKQIPTDIERSHEPWTELESVNLSISFDAFLNNRAFLQGRSKRAIECRLLKMIKEIY